MKKIGAWFLVLCMFFTLAACSSESSSEPEEIIPEIKKEEVEVAETAAPPVVKRHAADVIGAWSYDDYIGEVYVLIYEDGTFAEVDAGAGAIRVVGVYEEEDEDSITFYGDDGENVGWFDTFYFNDENGKALPSDELRSYYCGPMSYCFGLDDPQYQDILAVLAAAETEIPYFEEAGYEINYDLGEGGTYMKNGACVFTNKGDYYDRMYATVSMDLDSYNDTKDGFVEIEFTETTYMDVGDYPEFVFYKDFQAGMAIMLCDYYTGCELPATSTYGDTSRGENYHYYEYESQGRQVRIDHNYSTDWKLDANGSYVIKVQHFLRMPADYDGVVYIHQEAPASYKEYVHNSDPGDTMPKIDDARVKNAIFCRLNTVG